MPVGTQGTLKGVAPEQLYDLGCPLILSNTYHLGHRPGGDVLEAHGCAASSFFYCCCWCINHDYRSGLHKFMNWNRNLLTDSGGFQMVSLSKLADVTEVRENFFIVVWQVNNVYFIITIIICFFFLKKSMGCNFNHRTTGLFFYIFRNY